MVLVLTSRFYNGESTYLNPYWLALTPSFAQASSRISLRCLPGVVLIVVLRAVESITTTWEAISCDYQARAWNSVVKERNTVLRSLCGDRDERNPTSFLVCSIEQSRMV